MTNTLILASAGAGKSSAIVADALQSAQSGKTVLIITYTDENQNELLKKICAKFKIKPSNIVIKGWFTFLLEDLIRPYQSYIFPTRVQGTIFNQSNPHLRNGKYIKGRSELIGNKYNPAYFLTKNREKAYTYCLSKLALNIIKVSAQKSIKRLSEIYSDIYIDEVQDLVGYDYEIIKVISTSDINKFTCVGDFRQTIYSTTSAKKAPSTNVEKIAAFDKLGFTIEHKNISWRCVQGICDFADLIHKSDKLYQPAVSMVNVIPTHIGNHCGIYTVSQKSVLDYMTAFNPIILRVNKTIYPELCDGRISITFGKSKGCGYPHILIIPTDKIKNYLAGDETVFNKDKTPEAINKFYVAVTRAHYSVAFLYEGNVANAAIKTWVA